MNDYVNQNQQSYNLLAGFYKENAARVESDITRIIEPFLKSIKKNPSILELGCGAGVATEIFFNSGSDVTVVDFSENMLMNAKSRVPLAKFIHIDVLKYIPSHKFDGIFISAFIHLFKEMDAIKILSMAKKTLLPNGIVYVDTSSHDTFEEGMQSVDYHESGAVRYRVRHTAESFRSLIRRAGLEIVSEWTNVGHDGKSRWLDVLCR